MQAHSFLDEDKLTRIVLFRDENGAVVGLITYDTSYDDRVYLIHKSSEKPLLERMIETVLESEGLGAVMKVNAKDAVLCRMLREKGFEKKHKCGSVLSLDLSNSLEYDMPDAYTMSPRGFAADPWQYRLVIHRGFENDGIPEKWEDAFLKRIPHGNEDLKTFAIAHNEYCAHCGLWYTTGDTAYVEPVATVPEHRKQGLAKARHCFAGPGVLLPNRFRAFLGSVCLGERGFRRFRLSERLWGASGTITKARLQIAAGLQLF